MYDMNMYIHITCKWKQRIDEKIFLQNALKSRITLSKGSIEVTLRIQVNTTKRRLTNRLLPKFDIFWDCLPLS